LPQRWGAEITTENGFVAKILTETALCLYS
jgi:hypothetical protein